MTRKKQSRELVCAGASNDYADSADDRSAEGATQKNAHAAADPPGSSHPFVLTRGAAIARR